MFHSLFHSWQCYFLQSMQVMPEARDRIPCEAGVPVEMSHTAVSTTEHYFTHSVMCLIVECTRRQRKGNQKKQIQIFEGRHGFKWIKRSVPLQYYTINKKNYYYYFIYHSVRMDKIISNIMFLNTLLKLCPYDYCWNRS